MDVWIKRLARCEEMLNAREEGEVVRCTIIGSLDGMMLIALLCCLLFGLWQI